MPYAIPVINRIRPERLVVEDRPESDTLQVWACHHCDMFFFRTATTGDVVCDCGGFVCDADTAEDMLPPGRPLWDELPAVRFTEAQ